MLGFLFLFELVCACTYTQIYERRRPLSPLQQLVPTFQTPFKCSCSHIVVFFFKAVFFVSFYSERHLVSACHTFHANWVSDCSMTLTQRKIHFVAALLALQVMQSFDSFNLKSHSAKCISVTYFNVHSRILRQQCLGDSVKYHSLAVYQAVIKENVALTFCSYFGNGTARKVEYVGSDEYLLCFGHHA